MTWRPRRFRVGAMRERINIRSSTDVVDTAGQPIRTWSTVYANEPAEFTPTSGGESLRGRQIESGINSVFVVHYHADIVPTMQVVHGSTIYGIVRVRQTDGGKRYMELECKAVV